MFHNKTYLDKHFISVVIPAYNEEIFIKKCLDAIAAQTMQPHAVYIVDNNSNDRSIEIARSYPFVTILQESTQGICASTKTGFDAAAKNGGIILRLDADCQPDADWISKMYQAFLSDAKVVAATGPGVAIDVNPFARFLMTALYMNPYFYLVGLTLGQKPLFGSNCAVRADTWKKISSRTHLASHQNIHDDIDISYHLVRQGKIAYIRDLKMQMSARPFRTSFPKLFDRYMRGFRSIFIHWPQQTPWRNWWVTYIKRP